LCLCVSPSDLVVLPRYPPRRSSDLSPCPPPAGASLLTRRFRGYLPVVVDVETGGFDWNRHALLEIAVVPIDVDGDGALVPGEPASTHVEPAPGTALDPHLLDVTRVDLDHPFRFAKAEKDALDHVFATVRAAVRKHGCQRAILV